MMTMLMLIKAAMTSALITTSTVKNPMKMGIMMVGSSLAMSWTMYKETGKSWFAANMFILFMGGILLMFMILSSTMPNEKMSKSKGKMVKTMMLTFMMFAMMTFNQENSSTNNLAQIKWFLTNSKNLIAIIMVMMIYFASFVNLMSMNKNSMRS